MNKQPLEWSSDDVGEWLEENGFEDYVDLFCKKHRIDGAVLLTLTESDLRNPPLQISILGDLKHLMMCINKLQKQNKAAVKQLEVGNGLLSVPHVYGRRRQTSVASDDSHDGALYSKHLNPEIWKTFLSFFYVFFVFLITSCVMVIVHDRVPDMKKYPPLPDIVLDNVPFMPWAFEVSEVIAVFLGIIWVLILFFHKHRFILMRRMFSLSGTIFLLRSVSMLITSLSVPGIHLECSAQHNDTLTEKFARAYEIWRGFGMSLKGVRSCGDYMFSGHTCFLTLFNFFITEYTPRRYHLLHTTCWVLNLFGIFFILAAHEHYSIDVFIAFYLTSRLFLYYHTLANNRAVMVCDRRRTRVWFPLFSFFESRCDGIVPNEYEWPLKIPTKWKTWFGMRKQNISSKKD